ncbi:MAG: hypothetical protein CMH81_03640 [Nitrospiraceae bacterium]|nr:hypothetical protein [Nitrospiraceae bacterium]
MIYAIEVTMSIRYLPKTHGVHLRPQMPDPAANEECPKFMSHGPCGGVRAGGFCEVYPTMTCPWFTMYSELEKIGRLEWMRQV